MIFVSKREQITNKEGFWHRHGRGSGLRRVDVSTRSGAASSASANAWFESVSLTTTGSTILNDVEAPPRGLQFWRAGVDVDHGMGVVIPRQEPLPMGAVKMISFNVELSTMASDNTATADHRRFCWWSMSGLPCSPPCCSKWCGANWFDALCHAMSVCATSAILSTKNASIAFTSTAR